MKICDLIILLQAQPDQEADIKALEAQDETCYELVEPAISLYRHTIGSKECTNGKEDNCNWAAYWKECRLGHKPEVEPAKCYNCRCSGFVRVKKDFLCIGAF